MDSIWLEREFLKISRHIDAICEELDSFKCALFDESMFGISVKALYLSCHAYQQSIDLTHIGKSYNVNSLGDLLAKFERLLTYYHLIDNQKSPTLTLPEGEGTHRTLLNNRKSFAHLQASDLKIICAMLEEIFPKTKLIENSVRQHTNIELSFNDLLVLYQSKDKLKELNLILSEVAIASLFEQCVKIPIAGITKIKTQIKSIGKSISQPIETTLAADELLVIGNKIENAITHFERIDKKIYWLIFSKDKKQIDNLLNNNALKSNLPDLKLLFQRVSNRQKLEKQLDDLQKYFTNDLGKIGRAHV